MTSLFPFVVELSTKDLQGVTPNFDNPSLNGYHSITIASSICVAMLVFFGSVRLYSKLKIIRKSSLDDCKLPS
jgi:hypothetical protein